MASWPPSLKPIAKYMARAREVESENPLVAHYCTYYSLKRAVELRDPKDEGANRFIAGLLEKCDTSKVKLGPDDGTHRACMEEFALRVFDFADTEDREGRANKEIAQAFFAAMCYLDVCSVFGPLSTDLNERLRYAQWKAADILKALREGRTPTPGPPGGIGGSDAGASNDSLRPSSATASANGLTTGTEKGTGTGTNADGQGPSTDSIPPAPEDREYDSEVHEYEPAKGSPRHNDPSYPPLAPAFPSSNVPSPLYPRNDAPSHSRASMVGDGPPMAPAYDGPPSPPPSSFSQPPPPAQQPASSLSDHFSKAMVLYKPDSPPTQSAPYEYGGYGNNSMPSGHSMSMPTGPSMGMPHSPSMDIPHGPPMDMPHGPPMDIPQPYSMGLPPNHPIQPNHSSMGIPSGPNTNLLSGHAANQLPEHSHSMDGRFDPPHNFSHGGLYPHPMNHGPSHGRPPSSYLAPHHEPSHTPHLAPPHSGPHSMSSNPSYGSAYPGPHANSMPAAINSNYRPNIKDMREAQRHARNASSALDFQDFAAARSNLEMALRLLSG